MDPWTQPFLAVCPVDGRCIDSFPDNSNCFVWERRCSAEDTASSTAPQPRVYCLCYIGGVASPKQNNSRAPHCRLNKKDKRCCMVQTPVNMDNPGHFECQGKPPIVSSSSLASDSLHLVLVLQAHPSLRRRTIRLTRYPSQTLNLQTSPHRWPKVIFIFKFRFL